MHPRVQALKNRTLRYRRALWIYYSAPQLKIFKQLRNGFIYFSVGLLTVYLANLNLALSVQLELITLGGLLLCAIGFTIAMLAYVRLLISRIVNFFGRK